MTEHKRYTITTENVRTTGDFTEEEIEKIRRQFHGIVRITEHVTPWNFQQLADDIFKEARKDV